MTRDLLACAAAVSLAALLALNLTVLVLWAVS